MKTKDSFNYARFNDSTVAKMLENRNTPEEIIGILASEKRALFDRIIELEHIVPKKFQLPDGTFAVWHCPNEFNPNSNNTVKQEILKTGEMVQVKPVTVRYTFPAFEKRDESISMEVAGIELTFRSVEEPPMDAMYHLDVDENGYCPNYPFLEVICIKQTIESYDGEKYKWVKRKQFIPMI